MAVSAAVVCNVFDAVVADIERLVAVVSVVVVVVVLTLSFILFEIFRPEFLLIN